MLQFIVEVRGADSLPGQGIVCRFRRLRPSGPELELIWGFPERAIFGSSKNKGYRLLGGQIRGVA